MSSSSIPAPLSPSDYEMIEAAVMETEKGRWFLAEYASRHRSADTALVLEAIARLEAMLSRGGGVRSVALRETVDEAPAPTLREREDPVTGRRFVGIEYIEQSLAELRSRAPADDDEAEQADAERPAPAPPMAQAAIVLPDDPLARLTRQERYALFS